LKRIQRDQLAAADQARKSQQAIADTGARATVASETHAAMAVECERSWSRLKEEDMRQRQKLADLLDEFKASSEPIRKSLK
jgi:hypothetical protein